MWKATSNGEVYINILTLMIQIGVQESDEVTEMEFESKIYKTRVNELAIMEEEEGYV